MANALELPTLWSVCALAACQCLHMQWCGLAFTMILSYLTLQCQRLKHIWCHILSVAEVSAGSVMVRLLPVVPISSVVQGLGKTTMFCGDGINDLAALSAADVGMAIGADAVIAAELSTTKSSVAGQPPTACNACVWTRCFTGSPVQQHDMGNSVDWCSIFLSFSRFFMMRGLLKQSWLM